MIELKITQSKDFDRIGEYYFGTDLIHIGTAVDTCHLYLPLEDITDPFINIEISENKLYAIPEQEGIYFHVNGKKTTGKKLIKVKDIISIGSTHFELISFAQEIYKTKKEFLNNKVQQLQDENSELISILQNLSNYEAEL